jgi:hypothetical protein
MQLCKCADMQGNPSMELCFVTLHLGNIYSTRMGALVLVHALDANALEADALDALQEQDNHLVLVFS